MQHTELPTPCLLIDADALNANIATMSAALPGTRLRPHVKTFKCTALARMLHDAGHTGFCCATLREVDGLLEAGLGDDVLLANETVDVDRLTATVELARRTGGNVTIAVDSGATIAAATAAGVTNVLIDVNVGLPRCGCPPDRAGELAAVARADGLTVRGVMGYEGHLMMVDADRKPSKVAAAMKLLRSAHEAVGGDIVSAGGTGTFAVNDVATEIQAGSYLLMDTQYGSIDLPFRQALWVEATVISADVDGQWIVADAGLKALGMDHGDPTWDGGDVWFCSDEHITLRPNGDRVWSVGDRVHLAPAHVDPTVAKHERMWLVEESAAPVAWDVDLRHW